MSVNFELFWLLLLPLLFTLGWFAARIDMRHVVKDAKQLPQEYYKAVEALLNENSEEAVQNFLDILRVNPETIEVYFTLGRVLRKRGDVERAIRVHQNLLTREDLGKEVQEKAKFELAQDFLEAGIFDRAETLFEDLLQTKYAVEARKFLLRLYPSVQEWDKAFEVAKAVEHETGQSLLSSKVHFLCQSAQFNMKEGSIELAIEKIQQAQRLSPQAIRPVLLQAELEAGQGLWQTAVSTLNRLYQENESAVRLIAPLMLKITQTAEQSQVGIEWAEKISIDSIGIEGLEALVGVYMSLGQQGKALESARSHWQKYPDLARFNLWVRTASEVGQNSEKDLAQTLLSSVGGILRREARYQCHLCDFHLRRHAWQCPGCLSWDSFSLYRQDERQV
jgi:lipopolysaccharide biosynthesis regulator YciM